MTSHFTGFTPKAMKALGDELAANFQNCKDVVESTRANTFAMLEKFQTERLERTETKADARRVFASELRSDVHALRSRFDMDRDAMASEIHAASQAFQKSRPRGSTVRPEARTAAPSRPTPPSRPARSRKH